MENRKRKLFKVNYIHYYEARRYISTCTEVKYYNDLLEIAERYGLILLSKVSIYEVVKIKDTPYKRIALLQCGQETIDFILANKEDCKVRVCIKLDDPYLLMEKKHFKKKKFVDELFDRLDIKLVRFVITDEYHKENIENKIRNIISQPVY